MFADLRQKQIEDKRMFLSKKMFAKAYEEVRSSHLAVEAATPDLALYMEKNHGRKIIDPTKVNDENKVKWHEHIQL